jgi:hypothetical protein
MFEQTEMYFGEMSGAVRIWVTGYGDKPTHVFMAIVRWPVSSVDNQPHLHSVGVTLPAGIAAQLFPEYAEHLLKERG